MRQKQVLEMIPIILRKQAVVLLSSRFFAQAMSHAEMRVILSGECCVSHADILHGHIKKKERNFT